MFIKKCLLVNSKQNGMGLIEVLVAVLVIAVGLFGLAKMQALSVSNAALSSTRSIIALQAGSFAALLHGNKAYWQGGAGATLCTGTTCTLSGSATSIFGAAPALSACQSTSALTSCTGAQVAALDINTWMGNMNTLVPNYVLTLTCSGTPTNCSIRVTWYEKAVGMNQTTATFAAANSGVQQAYYLYVQP